MSRPRNVPPEVAARRSTVAGLVRQGAEPERVEAARTELRAANAESTIRRLVDQAPSLSEDQLDRLAAILRPTPRNGTTA